MSNLEPDVYRSLSGQKNIEEFTNVKNTTNNGS